MRIRCSRLGGGRTQCTAATDLCSIIDPEPDNSPLNCKNGLGVGISQNE